MGAFCTRHTFVAAPELRQRFTVITYDRAWRPEVKLGLSARIQLSRWMADVTSDLDPAPGTVYVTESHGGEAPCIAYATIAYQG